MESYPEYLQSPEWQRKREDCFASYGKMCAVCGSTQKLEVHHLTYDNIGDEKPYELIPLCHACHERMTKAIAEVDEIAYSFLRSSDFLELKKTIEAAFMPILEQCADVFLEFLMGHKTRHYTRLHNSLYKRLCRSVGRFDFPSITRFAQVTSRRRNHDKDET